MPQTCQACGASVESEASFCTECGARLTEGPEPVGHEPQPDDMSARLPELKVSDVEVAEPGAELVVEIETNRPYMQGYRSQLRFRVTNNIKGPCGVTLYMLLHGRGDDIQQDESEIEHCHQFEKRGEQRVFAFPFKALTPGDFPIERLRMAVTRGDGARIYELPDRSLYVPVADPNRQEAAPGVVIQGGIQIDQSQMNELYGSDVKELVNINVDTGRTRDEAQLEWQAIRLSLLEQTTDVSGLPPTLSVALPDGASLELVRVRPGQFTMGTPDDQQGKDDERPSHTVRITRDFYIGRFPVTQEQYQSIAGQNPSKCPGPRHPADNVSWSDATEFCRKLRAYLARTPEALGGAGVAIADVALPSEAEWEYACRAGTVTAFSFGDDRSALPEYGWFDKNASRTTHAVGELKPNAWGLHDMHGNVWEWCKDFYLPDYYEQGDDSDPAGPTDGDRRVLRGGSWSYYAKQCRSASRHAAAPSDRTANYGFRVAVHM